MAIELNTRKGKLVEVINLGNFLLDGGTMFGRIPKAIWEKWFPSDERNRILMATNILRIYLGDGMVYQIDAGLGSLYTDKEKDILGIDRTMQNPVSQDKRIDYLVLTHLHFDHCGGISDLEVKESVIVSRQEWEDTQKVTELTRKSYRQRDLKQISQKLLLVEPPMEVSPGIEIIPTPGHTKGHASILVDNEIFFAGDLLPTYAHVHLPCIMAYDLYPTEIVEVKKKMLNRARSEGWTIIFEHDPYTPMKKASALNN